MADRLLAEFEDEHALGAAIRRLRERGHRELEAYVPFPSPAVEDALARRPSRLPIAIFAFGLVGAGGAYFLQWLLNGFLYPLDVGGRPPHLPLVFVIITFEMAVLLAALCAFLGPLLLGRLFRLTDDVQALPGFESVTRDRFWLEVSVDEPAHHAAQTRDLLTACGATRIELATEPG